MLINSHFPEGSQALDLSGGVTTMSDAGSECGAVVKEKKRGKQHQTQKVSRYPVCGTGLMHMHYLPLEFKLETREGDSRIVDFCMVNLKAIP